jgi:hypothetical protein
VGTAALTLWNVLGDTYHRLGFDPLADKAFRAMVLARVIEPTSKADTVRVLDEIGAPAPTVKTLFRALARCQQREYRGKLAAACLAHATADGALGLILYDVTTLHFEAEKEDSLRKVGMSKERRVDPQVQVGLLVDRSGFPLEVHCVGGCSGSTPTACRGWGTVPCRAGHGGSPRTSARGSSPWSSRIRPAGRCGRPKGSWKPATRPAPRCGRWTASWRPPAPRASTLAAVRCA